MLILTVAANTSFADFPRGAALLAKDGFLPRQFTGLGNRGSAGVCPGPLVANHIAQPDCMAVESCLALSSA